MIHYTLQGPTYNLEIHEDKIYLKRKSWWKPFSSRKNDKTWNLDGLKVFNITEPQNYIWGKLEWESFDGAKGTLHFSTNGEVVQKIEKYMHKKILKNLEKIKVLSAPVKVEEEAVVVRHKKSKKQRREENLAA